MPVFKGLFLFSQPKSTGMKYSENSVLIHCYFSLIILVRNNCEINFKCCFVLVKVKWGKETYPDIEVNTDESPILFKAQLFALTGVQPERQKVMLKGVTLKDEEWKNFNIKDVSVYYIKHLHTC